MSVHGQQCWQVVEPHCSTRSRSTMASAEVSFDLHRYMVTGPQPMLSPHDLVHPDAVSAISHRPGGRLVLVAQDTAHNGNPRPATPETSHDALGSDHVAVSICFDVELTLERLPHTTMRPS